MKILLVGGGSGGHITPLKAVAEQIKHADSRIQLHAVSERGGKFTGLLRVESDIKLHSVFAGKWRRYHDESWLRRLVDFNTNLLNLRDVVLLSLGLVESILLLVRLRPQAAFIKGGFVGVPVGYACRLLRVPYITHDSDAKPGLANRLIGGGALYNAVGMPPENYTYNKNKVVYTGVPVSREYTDHDISNKSRIARSELGIKSSEKLLLIMGGSLGAQKLDLLIHACLDELLRSNDDLAVIHQVGEGNENIYGDYPETLKERITVKRFLNPLAPYSMASDLVITRAGATAIAELAAISKPIILVPAMHLTGGHQLQNAQSLNKSGAAVIVEESASPEVMKTEIEALLHSKSKSGKLASNLHKTVPHDAAAQIAKLLISITGRAG